MQPIPGRAELQELGRRLRRQFAEAEPFPHVVIDDFLPPETVRMLIDEFPIPDPRWLHFDDPNQRKFALRDEEVMPGSIRSVVQQFNAQVFIEFLETLTGIKGLLPDPHLSGGGLHQIPRGGTLNVHVDFNQHEKLDADRRLNVLLYLNEDWDESFGGSLELWDRQMTGPVVRVAPVANRMVVFETTSTSYHGHPDVLAVPEGRFRRSLAWYYYTTPDAQREEKHNTVWTQERGGAREKARKTIRRWVPPALMDVARPNRGGRA
jgi:Rps23 Pro-64 3,4-dihydroxylase Tpa1-like proline 4-hydroxylase